MGLSQPLSQRLSSVMLRTEFWRNPSGDLTVPTGAHSPA